MNWSRVTAVVLTVGAILGVAFVVLQLTFTRDGRIDNAIGAISFFGIGILHVALGVASRREVISKAIFWPTGLVFLLIGALQLNTAIQGSEGLSVVLLGVIVIFAFLGMWNMLRMRERLREDHGLDRGGRADVL